ncbi:MAG TPA: histidine kinase dimerization/phospho-acceptor domain-containing protein [Candidatus Solibacter sp.]|nr:histidine kinase dimerization/phospho-acceptor domain-containing protein [Candidatus Solibacter sp.]
MGTELHRGTEAAGDSTSGGHTLVRTLAAELRGPLAGIRVGAEMLTRRDMSPAQSQRLARNVLAATARVEEILSDFALERGA